MLAFRRIRRKTTILYALAWKRLPFLLLFSRIFWYRTKHPIRTKMCGSENSTFPPRKEEYVFFLLIYLLIKHLRSRTIGGCHTRFETESCSDYLIFLPALSPTYVTLRIFMALQTPGGFHTTLFNSPVSTAWIISDTVSKSPNSTRNKYRRYGGEQILAMKKQSPFAAINHHTSALWFRIRMSGAKIADSCALRFSSNNGTWILFWDEKTFSNNILTPPFAWIFFCPLYQTYVLFGRGKN